jgi:penicillin-binding protein 1A
LGTVKRKGRKQTNRTYGYRATSRLYQNSWSPELCVTLKEMVAAYGTMANGGGHLEPLLVSRIEDRDGRVIEDFSPQDPEMALERDVAYTLLDNPRSAINRGTGRDFAAAMASAPTWPARPARRRATRTAGSSRCTGSWSPGWWVGFNDSRVTLRSDYWDQGAHSAVPAPAP